MSYLINVIVDDSKLPKLLHFSGNVVELVQIDGQRRLIDDRLHTGDSEAVVVGVVEASVDHAVFAEAEYLPVDQRADLPVSDGADEALALQVDRFKHAGRLVVGEAHACGVVQDLCQFILTGQTIQHSVRP